MIILIISCSDDSINNSQSNEYFNISIEETGESTLFIFLDTINNLNNSISNLELVIVDDNSSDGTVDIIKKLNKENKYKAVFRKRHQEHF